MTKTSPEVRALLAHWKAAGVDAKAAGRVWYRASRGEARRLKRRYGVSLSVAAGVIAALSPRVQWALNVRMANDVLATGTCRGLGNSRRSAQRIIAGERPLDVLQGQKVRAFYRAIMGDESAAVIDVWMLRALGEDPTKAPNARRYAELSEALALAAATVGIGTATFQAIIWTHIRGGAE